MNKRTFTVGLRNKFDADIIDILVYMKLNRISASAVIRDLLRGWRDRGYPEIENPNKEDIAT